MSICASCKRHGVNTFAYTRDMLVRVPTEPAGRIRELPPDRWKAERDAAAREAAAARTPPA
ncbi:MAG: transposase domain-containing protein [Planctomycetota bacterium]